MARKSNIALLMTLVYLHLCWTTSIEFIDDSDGMLDSHQDYGHAVNVYAYDRPCSWFKICLCSDSYVDCSQRDLEYIPQHIPLYVTNLKLRGNKISNIEPGIFQNMSELRKLDLSSNNVSKLHVNSFQGLRNLTHLYLNGNKIRYTSTAIQLEVFKPLTSLVHLNIQQDLDNFQSNEDYPVQQIAEIPALVSISMDTWFSRPFNETFSDLFHLSTFESSGQTGRCNFIQIKENMFIHLKNITSLILSNCSISFVEHGSFSELKKLKKIDLSYNTALEFKSIPNITYGIRNRNILKLKLNNIHPTIGDCTRLEVDHLKYTSHMKIKYMYLAGNRLSFINETAIDFVPRTFEGLYLKNNRFAYGNYVIKAFINGLFANVRILIISEQDSSTVIADQLPSVTTMLLTRSSRDGNASEKDVSHKPKTALAGVKISNETTPRIETTGTRSEGIKGNIYCSNCRGINATKVPISENITYVDFSDQKSRQSLERLCFCEPNRLGKLFLQKNVIWSVQGPFYGLKNLFELNLDWNSCENISKLAFRSMPNLEYLYLDRNFLSESLSADVSGEIFLHLTKLKMLTISDNKLRFLPTNIFKGVISLEQLNLSYNFLSQFNLQLSHIRRLQELYLQNNLIETISKDVRVYFDDLTANGNLSIDLSENILKCACPDIELLDWFATTRVRFINFNSYMCEYTNGSRDYISNAAMIRDRLKRECADYKILIICLVCTFVIILTVFIAVFVYRYRWHLRYMYYSARTKWNRNGYIKISESAPEDPDFQYDVFVSYAATDGAFVKESVATELEDKRAMKLLIHDRDFRAGEFVNDNIMKAIIESRKTLIILSQAFLQSHWCRFEMNMARMESIKTGRNVLCVLMKEDVPANGLPLEILDIIRNRTYLEMPDELHCSDVFWDRLKDTIRS